MSTTIESATLPGTTGAESNVLPGVGDLTPAQNGSGKGGKGKGKGGKKPPKPTSDPKEIDHAVGDLTVLPDGTARSINLKDLTIHADMQQRDGLADGLTDPYTVEQYTALEREYPDSDPLPPIRAIDTTVAGEKDSKGNPLGIVVYDGFQRYAARKAAGKKEILCIVTPGTKNDALFYSLHANATHGLSRSRKDCQKALRTLTGNPVLMARVTALADNVGGLCRAMAFAAGVSKGSVANFLDAADLCVSRGKIVPKPKPRTETEAPAAGGTGGAPAVTPAPVVDSAPLPEGDLNPRLAFANLNGLAEKVQLNLLAKVAKQLGCIIASLTADKVKGSPYRRLLSYAGIGVSQDYVTKLGTPGEDFSPPMEILEHWTVVKQLSAFAEAGLSHVAGDDQRADHLASQAGQDAIQSSDATVAMM